MRTVFVTGGIKGIGSSISLHLCQLGYNVVFSYNKNQTLANKLIKKCEDYPGKIYISVELPWKKINTLNLL